jgi:signal transduction histidine kinase
MIGMMFLHHTGSPQPWLQAADSIFTGYTMKSNQISAAPPVIAALRRNPGPLLRTALIVATYFCAFTILDLFSQQFEELRGVVVWYPPAGLTYTLLLVFGVKFAPAVMIALLFSSLFLYRMPQPPYLLFLWAFIISMIYSVAAVFLRRRIRFDWQLRKLRDVTWLVVTTVFVSAILAILSVSSSALSSDMPRSEVFLAIFHWWIGETVGVLTVTPFLLIYVMPGLKRFAVGQPIRLLARRSFPRLTLAVIAQVSSLAIALYWVFGARVLGELRPIYLIILPLIWIALQHGFKGVALGLVALNFGIMLAVWVFQFDLARLGELQLLMIVNCIVSLLMGAIVTERKQAEEEIRQLNAELEQRVEERTSELRGAQEKLVHKERLAMLGQVAGSIGHELRNPLGVISNAIYFLKLIQPDANEKIKEYLGMIEHETHTANMIITDLLDFSRIKSLNQQAVNVAGLVQQTLERFPIPASVGVNIEIPLDFQPVYANPHQMMQVLGNLIVNACQAMPEGGKLDISATLENDMISIAVHDNGVGISPENIGKLFEPLFTTKTKGIGLGLTICKNLAEANSGRIDVQSEFGKGSIFTIFLPVYRS